MAPVHLLHALQRPQNRALPTVEQTFELPIGEVAQFAGDDGALVCDEEHLRGGVHVAHFIGCHERAGDVLLAIGDPGLFGIKRAAHGLEDDGLLAGEVGDEAGAVMVVDAKDLQDAGVRQEGAGAAAIGCQTARNIAPRSASNLDPSMG